MTFWNWEKKTSEPEKPAQKPPTVKEFEKKIDEVKDAIDDIQRKIDPQRQRVRESVDRQRLGVGTTPALEDAETRERNDAAAQASKRLAAESQSRQQQGGESDADYQFRINRLHEREIRQHLTGAQCMERDALIQKMAKDDFLRKTPHPVGRIIKVEDDRYVCQFQPHPSLPKKQMSGDCFVVRQVLKPYLDAENQPRLEHVKGQVGDVGTLRSQSNGLTVSWLFVVSAA